MLLAKEYKLLTKQAPLTSWSSHEDMFNKGLPVEVISTLSDLLNTDKKQVAGVIGLTVRRINQIENNPGTLNKIATERALLITQVFRAAKDYFGSTERTQAWFNAKNMSLGDKTPLELCRTYTGIELVKNTIIQLEHGMTA